MMPPRRRDWARWSAAFVLASLAHGGFALAVLANWQDSEAAGTPVVIELEMVSAAADAAMSEGAPGPTQTRLDTPSDTAEPEPEHAEPEPEPVEQAALEPLLPDPVEVPAAPAEPELVAPARPPEPKLKPKRDTKRETKKPERKPKRQRSAAATTAPSAADTVAAIPTARAFGQGASRAMPSWTSRIIAHLHRHKRYPADAEARGDTGVAHVTFTIDRDGRVLASRLAASSGVPALDRETAALVQRAQPLPPAPAELAGSRFSFRVPIRYDIR